MKYEHIIFLTDLGRKFTIINIKDWTL
jgi:hypothetical protein